MIVTMKNNQYRNCFSVRNLLAWLLCAVLLGLLSSCVQVGEEGVKEAEKPVYPSPPDEPRFVYERTIAGSADVVPQTEESALKLALTGVSDNITDRLSKPYSVAVHRGRIFVSDTKAYMVKAFDVPEGRYFRIGAEDPGKLGKPLGIDVDGAGNLYVADSVDEDIKVYNRDGKFLRKIAGPSFIDRLASVTVDKKGERLYVVDIGGVRSQNHRVRVFNAQTGEFLFDIGKRGVGDGEFNLPRKVAIGKNNQLYVVDGGNFRIQVFDSEGKFLRTFGQIGVGLGSFARPKEAATDKDGNLYVIDAAFGNFQIFNPEGQLLMFVGSKAELKNKHGGFALPAGIFVDEDGRIYVTDQVLKKIEIFRPYGLGEQEGYLVRKTEAQKKQK